MLGFRLLCLTLATTVTTGCDRLDGADAELAELLAERATRLERTLAQPDSIETDAPVARWILPDRLREISGLALSADDRLFVHGDEVGTIYEIDYRRGTIVKEFSLGSPAVRGDFEAITFVGDSLVMLTSDGILYQFAEGDDGATVPFTRVDTGLGERCEFEGLTVDSAANAFVLACKNVRDDDLDDMVVLFRWPLRPDGGDATLAQGPLVVPFAAVIGTRTWKQFEPSDITINPANGNYLVVAARQQGLAEFSPAGDVVLSRSLPPGHPQAEGLAVTRDNLLLVSDEANSGPAVLTAYRWQP